MSRHQSLTKILPAPKYKIEFNGTAEHALKRQAQLQKSFNQVIKSGVFLNGPQAALLENKLKKYFNIPYVKTVASGHDALILALQSLQLKSHDEVIVQANAYPSAFPVIMAGLKIKLIDVNQTGQLDLETLQQTITPKTKVVLLTHLFGACSDVAKIATFCRQHNLILIEDCAQAFGSRYRGLLLGTFGQIGCLSFYPTKNLGALGDGGAIITSDTRTYDYLKQAAQYGEVGRYLSKFVAGHSRLPELQAAALNLYLKDLPKIKLARSQVYRQYQQAFSKLLQTGHIRYLAIQPKTDPFFHLLVVEAKHRDQLRHYLQAHQIPTLIHYPLSLDQVPAFASHVQDQAPIAQRLAANCLSLPFHEYLRKSQVTYIVKVIEAFYAQEKITDS